MNYELRTASLVPQRLNGVEIGGFPCRIDAEKEPNSAGNTKADQHPHGRKRGRQTDRKQVDDPGEHSAQRDSYDAADGAQRDRFGGELREDGPFGCSNGLADADFAGALSMFITPTPPTISPTLETAIMNSTKPPVS